MAYVAFVLSEQSRRDLLALFPITYDRRVCHHITIQYGDRPGNSLDDVFQGCMNHLRNGVRVTGIYNDGKGVETLSVEFQDYDDQCNRVMWHDERWDGRKYHITHSLGSGRQPVESLEVVGVEEFLVRKIDISITGEFQFLE